MSLSPHQILARLADHERDKARDKLANLAKQKKDLLDQKLQVETSLQQLLVQREEVLKGLAQASMLIMMNDAMSEKQQLIQHIQQQMYQLKLVEKDVMKVWIAANQKCDTHEKMQRTDDKREARKQGLRVQQQMDDIFSARKSREG